MSNPIRQVTMEEFAAHLKSAAVTRRITEVWLHHTWRPLATEYRGLATWQGIDKYHREERGWAGGIGYHVGTAKDKSVWLLRPLARSGAHVLNKNANSVGVVMVGDYDNEDPAQVVPTAARIVALLLERFGLGVDAVKFHREAATKTCPGTRVRKLDFIAAVEAAMKQEPVPGEQVVIVEGFGAEPERVVRGANARVEAGGKLRADVRPLLEGLGYKVHAEHLATQGKLYVEPPGG